MQMQRALRGANFWLLLLLIAAVPAVCEELAFRGFILSGFRHLGHKWRAIVYSALLFGLAHGILQQSLIASLVGVVLGYLAVQSGSILPVHGVPPLPQRAWRSSTAGSPRHASRLAAVAGVRRLPPRTADACSPGRRRRRSAGRPAAAGVVRPAPLSEVAGRAIAAESHCRCGRGMRCVRRRCAD